jgi:hypothetical protein
MSLWDESLAFGCRGTTLARYFRMITIRTKSPMSASGTEVFIDDVKIPHVAKIAFKHEVGDVPRLFLEMIAYDGVQISGDVYSVVDEIRYSTVCQTCNTVTTEQPKAMVSYLKEFTERHNNKVRK